jgi:hypothetical protein
MNTLYLGDSFDIVKRFFCHELSSMGYNIVVDPMFTGEWNDQERSFLHLIGASIYRNTERISERTVLFLDPDIGINKRGGMQHVSFQRLSDEASIYQIVFCFDQSFSRKEKPESIMQSKLKLLENLNCYGIYYNSHARFLFVSKKLVLLELFREHLIALGLPSRRFITL